MSGFSSIGSEDEYWWDGPSLFTEFIHKRGIFVGFALDSFVCKSIIGICKFNELYFDVWIRMERWGAIVWMRMERWVCHCMGCHCLKHKVCQV